MISNVRSELAARLRAHSEASLFGPVYGTVPRWTSHLQVEKFPFTFLELFGARSDSGAWHDEEYGARVVTVMLPIQDLPGSVDTDPGDPILEAQLAALPGVANNISVLRDTDFAADEEALASLISFYTPPEIDEVLAVTSSYLVVESP